MDALRRANRAARLARRTAFPGLRPLLERLLRDRSGNVVILAGAMFPAVIAGMGLGAEVGLWYFQQRKLQNAADVAAYAAGVRLKRGDKDGVLDTVAVHVARSSGYGGTNDDVANNPPTSGSYAGDNDAVEVILTETVPRALSSLFINTDITLSGRAVVAVSNSDPVCVLALSPDKPAAVNVTGSTDVSLSGCHIASNSTDSDAFSMSGAAELTADCIHTVGGAYVQKKDKLTKECDELETGIPPVADPYADLEEPVCGGVKVYCHSGMELKNEVELDAGIYIINGGNLKVNANANVTGTDVTFFLTNGASVEINGGAQLNLKAPTDLANPYAGVLFFADRTDPNISFTVNGNSSGIYQGAIYFPAGHIEFSGAGAGASKCIQVIANTVKFTGSSDFAADCDNAGVREMAVGGAVQIVE